MYWHRSTIKEVKGGIKAHSERGEIGQSWWAARWNQVIKGYNIGQRFDRGRRYARMGQVSSIKIQKGSITGIVYGSSEYHIEISVQTLDEKTWNNITKAILSKPIIVAKLLAGQMPEDTEKIFLKLKTNLFPKKKDIETDCSCPDWSNPCKHIVAVYLLVAEEFDRDPFLLFNLRGKTREELLNDIGITENHKIPKLKTKPIPVKKTSKKLNLSNPDTFWGNHNSKVNTNEISIPTVNAVLVKQLGGFPFWRGNDKFIPVMEEIYDKASKSIETFFEQDDFDNK